MMKSTSQLNLLRVASLFLVLVLLIPAAVSAADLPLETVQTGVIIGGLFTGVTGVWPETDATVEFTLPGYDRIEWAGLFTLVYGGHMEDNRSGWANTTLNGEILGTELLTIDAPVRGQVYHLNDNVNRVTSDYQIWYDVTDHIDGETVTARVVSEKVDPDWDGRIRYIALVAAYADDDGDEVMYWVNPGHAVTAESYNPDPMTTSFTTYLLAEAPDAAYLSVISTSGTDGYYHLSGAELPRGGGLADGVRVNTWNVAPHIEPGVDTELSAEWGSQWGYKWTLATLVTGADAVLDVASVAFNPQANAGHRELFALQPNTIQARINNSGSLDAEDVAVRLQESGYTEEMTVPFIEAGGFALVNFTGYTPGAAGPVNLSIVAGEDVLFETTANVYYNGYKGKRWTNGEDIGTSTYFVGSVNVAYSTGDAAYAGNGWAEKTVSWPESDLPIPEVTVPYLDGAVVEARLYQGYTWNKMGTPMASVDPNPTMTFNGEIISPSASYTDRKGYGSYDHPGGLIVYDVTDLYNTSGNALTITPEDGADYAIYGSYLVVVHLDPEPVIRYIYLNEGFDAIQSHPGYCTDDTEATAYAPFININEFERAEAVAIVFGRPAEGKSAFLFNDEEYPGFWEAYQANPDPQVGFSTFDVTEALVTGDNEAAIRSVRVDTNGDSLVAAGMILVTESDDLWPFLEITDIAINPQANAGHRELFALQPNTIMATVTNIGTATAENYSLSLLVDNYTEDTLITSLGINESTTVNFTGFSPERAGDVRLKVTAGGVSHSMDATAYYNGYKGKRWTDGDDLITVSTYTGPVNVLYSTGDAAYAGNRWAEKTVTWLSDDLLLPEGAGIVDARLHQGYTWNKKGDPMGSVNPSPTMTFNGGIIAPDASYTDRKGYGGWDFPGGLIVYDVTDLFSSTGNTLRITPEEGADYAIYGSSLIVVYEHASEMQRSIRINEGYDIIQSHPGYCTDDEEATAYAPFTGIDAGKITAAEAVAIVQGRPNLNKSSFLFNGEEYEGFWAAYQADPDANVGYSVYDLTGAITQGVNEAGIRSVREGASGDSLQAVAVILKAEYDASTLIAGSVEARTRDALQVPVSVTYISDAEGFGFTLSYDPTYMMITNVTNASQGVAVTYEIDQQNNRVRVAVTTEETISAGETPVPVALVDLILTDLPGNGLLTLSDAVAEYSSGFEPRGFANTVDGTITSILKGDLNRNGRVDIGDVAKVAWMAVDLVEQDPMAKFTEPTTDLVNHNDAAKIAYYYVGKIPTL